MDVLEMRIFREHVIREIPRLAKQGGIGQEIDETELRQTALHGSQYIPGTTQAEIRLGNFEAVRGLLENFEFLHGIRIPSVG